MSAKCASLGQTCEWVVSVGCVNDGCHCCGAGWAAAVVPATAPVTPMRPRDEEECVVIAEGSYVVK